MRPSQGWPMLTRLLALSLLIGSASGCAPVTLAPDDQTPAICTGSRAARADLAAALADTQDERVLMAGARLVDVLDQGCANG